MVALKITDLSKRYKLGEVHEKFFINKLIQDIKSNLFRFKKVLKKNNRDPMYHNALNGLSFEVQQGEILGIIGKNGAGKSTLLKIISRITLPTKGKIEINGKVSSLLEVGTGFHPELTGRENVYLNGVIMGFKKKEIDQIFPEILEFSEMEKFIDTPVKRYSSGMYVRLAFAVAAHLNPDILLIDEVLAVGDVSFREKCLKKINDVSGLGKTILFISHNLPIVSQLCNRVIVLEEGKIAFDGKPREAIEFYLRSQNFQNQSELIFKEDSELPAQILFTKTCNQQGAVQPAFQVSEQISLVFGFKIRKPSDDYNFLINVTNRIGISVFSLNDFDFEGTRIGTKEGNFQYTITIPQNLLNVGSYNILVYLVKRHKGSFKNRTILSENSDALLSFRVDDFTSLIALQDRHTDSVLAPRFKWTLTEIT